jgi:hypothetical protein
MRSNPRESLPTGADGPPTRELLAAAEKNPGVFLPGNAQLLQSLDGGELFGEAVVKHPSSALIGALTLLSRTQLAYCMANAPSVVFQALADNHVDRDSFRGLPFDMRLFWYCVQTAPEAAVVYASSVLASARVGDARSSSCTQPNGYTMWDVMDHQPNPHNLPRETMLDEVIIFAVSCRTSTLARVILARAGRGTLTSDQRVLLEHHAAGHGDR